MPSRMSVVGQKRPIGRCRHNASFTLYVVDVGVNRIGTIDPATHAGKTYRPTGPERAYPVVTHTHYI